MKSSPLLDAIILPSSSPTLLICALVLESEIVDARGVGRGVERVETGWSRWMMSRVKSKGKIGLLDELSRGTVRITRIVVVQSTLRRFGS